VSSAGGGPAACVALTEDVILRKTASIQDASSDEHNEEKPVRLSRRREKSMRLLSKRERDCFITRSAGKPHRPKD
jgi:hypothetical protein